MVGRRKGSVIKQHRIIGIGDTYAEVSIADRQIWIYKEGKLVLTTNVVTGKHSTGEDTSPGVWYVLYETNTIYAKR